MSAPDAHADRSELGVDERGQCYALTDTGHAALAATVLGLLPARPRPSSRRPRQRGCLTQPEDEAPGHPTYQPPGPAARTAKNAQTQTCVSVRCDQCGDSPHSPDPDLEPHWPTADAALTAATAAGWHIDERPRLWCRDCQTVLLRCEARGHEFTEWRRCRCEQLIPAHHPAPGGMCGMELRYCVRCSVLESRPTPDQPDEVVLTCTDCDTTYEPSAEDIASGRSGCPDPDCGGWTFSSALTMPDTGGAA